MLDKPATGAQKIIEAFVFPVVHYPTRKRVRSPRRKAG